MREKPISAQVVIDTTGGTRKKPALEYKEMEFYADEVVGFCDSMIPGHSEIILPGGTFTIDMSYPEVRTLIHNLKTPKNAIEED